MWHCRAVFPGNSPQQARYSKSRSSWHQVFKTHFMHLLFIHIISSPGGPMECEWIGNLACHPRPCLPHPAPRSPAALFLPQLPSLVAITRLSSLNSLKLQNIRELESNPFLFVASGNPKKSEFGEDLFGFLNKGFGFQDLPWVTTSMTKFRPLRQIRTFSGTFLDFARKVCQKQAKTGVKS